MNLQNIVLIKSQFVMNRPVQGQIDNQLSLNTQVGEIQNLHTTAQVKVNLSIKAHEGTEEFGNLEQIYFVPVEFEDDDIMDPKLVGKLVMRQLIPMISSDVNFLLTKACLPMMPPTVMLNILKNEQ